MISIQTQTIEIKKPKDHIPKDIEQKNKLIETLTNRANLYEKRLEENKMTMVKM